MRAYKTDFLCDIIRFEMDISFLPFFLSPFLPFDEKLTDVADKST